MKKSIPISFVFGRLVATLRQRRGVSAQTLSNKLGSGRGMVAKIEIGHAIPALYQLFMLDRGLAAMRACPQGQLYFQLLELRARLEQAGVTVTDSQPALPEMRAMVPDWRATIDEIAGSIQSVNSIDQFDCWPDRSDLATGSLVRSLRNTAGLSQAAFSEGLPFAQSVLSTIESGSYSPTLEKLVALELEYLKLGVLDGPGALFRMVGELPLLLAANGWPQDRQEIHRLTDRLARGAAGVSTAVC